MELGGDRRGGSRGGVRRRRGGPAGGGDLLPIQIGGEREDISGEWGEAVGGEWGGEWIRERSGGGRPGPAWLARWPAGPRSSRGGFPPFVFFLFGFLFFFPFVFSFIISFLFKSFNPFSHFIKICLLHHNYLCNIRQPPNNFILNFENFYCFHQFEF